MQQARKLRININKNITGSELDVLISEKEDEIEDEKFDKEIGKIYKIEKTAKKWKFLQLIGFILLIIGLINTLKNNNELAIIFAVFGLLIIIFGRLLAWWFHG